MKHFLLGGNVLQRCSVQRCCVPRCLCSTGDHTPGVAAVVAGRHQGRAVAQVAAVDCRVPTQPEPGSPGWHHHVEGKP